jgi:hypothetical protein
VSLPARARTFDLRLVGRPAVERDGDRALRLDGKRACLKIPHALLDLPDGPFTVEGWVRPGDLAGRRALLGKTERSEYGLFLSDGVPTFFVHGGERYATAKAEASLLEEDRWHHVAGVFDGAEARLYVDGALVARVPAAGPRRKNTLPLYLGAEPDGAGRPNAHLAGLLDEIRISTGARYEADSFEPARRFEADEAAVLLLHCDALWGPFAVDATAGERHAFALGAVTTAPADG